MTLSGNPNAVDPGFNTPPSNPLLLLEQWLAKAEELEVAEPRGLVLSTVDNLGHPSSRVVLLKALDDKGIIFSSISISQKGQDLAGQSFAAGTLWWRETIQQINFNGAVSILPDNISDAIFNDRTIEAKAVAAISSQSEIMEDEGNLRAKVIKLVAMCEPIPRPQTWHAYHLHIQTIEFWHGSPDRFHLRLRYDRHEGSWQHYRLQP